MAKRKTTKRGNNEGSIYQKPNGKWVAMVTLGYDQNGKRIRKSFTGDTKTEVMLLMTDATMNKLKNGKTVIVSDTLHVLMKQWMLNFKRAEVTPRTFERCIGNANLHIYPTLGELKLSEITTNTIQTLLNKMLFNGYSLASVRKIKFLLNQFFAYAKRSGFISENPVTDCKVKSTSEHKEQKEENYKAIPQEARAKFMSAIKSSQILYPICMMQMFAGLRIGEVLALKWKDIKFEQDLIQIDNAITDEPIVDENGKVLERRTIISDTKTIASIRQVPMPPTLKECLLEWRQIRTELQAKTGIAFVGADDLVFSTNEGKLRTYYGTKHMFDKLMKQHGLAKYRFHFHTLRHTYSTMLFESKENPKVIQMLLGHREVTTTIRTYNSVDKTYFKQTSMEIENKWKK